MGSPPEKSRHRPLVLAWLILLLLLLSALVLREIPLNRSVHQSHTSNDSGVFSELSILKLFTGASSTTSAPPVPSFPRPARCAYDVELDRLRSESATGTAIGDIQPAAFAVVDLQRILEARQPETASLESRSNLLTNIKRISAARARAHNLEFVFDVSAQSLVGTPMLFASTNGVPDITDEVLKELPQ
jgi:hypothetical protein